MTKMILGMALVVCAQIGLASPVAAASSEASREARIPFASSVRDFRADGDRAIYVQDVHRQWYHGTFMSSCRDLPFANAIGFSNRGTGGLDRWATILVRGDRCTLTSFVKSEAPPARAKKGDDGKKASSANAVI